MGAVNPSKLRPKAEKPIASKKGGKVKKFSGDDESLIRPISGRYKVGDVTNESAGAEVGGDGPYANVMMPRMTRPTDMVRPDDVKDLPTIYSAGYRGRVGDVGLSAGLSKQDRQKMANLMANMPVGEGNLQAGMTDIYTDGRRSGRLKNLGYSGRVGDGELMGRLFKPEGHPMGAELRYSKQFKKGGKARKKK